MKKIILAIVYCFLILSVSAQSNEVSNRIKYITNAPDGTIAMTITDDYRENIMILESANNFYKYQLLDVKTGEPVLSSLNKGKECKIDKSKVALGTYYIRIYTRNFIITSDITLYPKKIIAEGNTVAFNEL